MSNADAILQELAGLCRDGHVHEPLLNGKAEAAGVYPPEAVQSHMPRLCETTGDPNNEGEQVDDGEGDGYDRRSPRARRG